MRTLLLCALVVALPAPLVRAQSLGELAAQEKARREKEREKKARPAAKVYTENDLQEGGTDSSKSSAPNRPASPAPSAPEPPSESESERAAEAAEADAALRARIADAKANLEAAREELKGFEDEVERLKQELNPMSTTYNTDAYVLFRLQGQLKDAADKADALRPKVAEAEKAWEAVERAARNAGIRTQ